MGVESKALKVMALVVVGLAAQPAAALSSYFTQLCAPCHSPAVVGSTATTCNGCHAHGTHPSSAKSTINVAGATNATSYTPGQTVSVTITGGYRTGWVRGVLFDQNMNQLAISTGPNTMGGGAGYPITLSAPAPTVAGSYTWNVAWYGNHYDVTPGVYGARWMDDPNNPEHGWEVVATNAFTVSAPTSPAIALAPSSLDFGTVTVGASASRSTAVQNTGTADLVVSSIALCTTPPTDPEFSWTAPATPFTVAPGGSTPITVTFAAIDPDVDTGCIAFTSNAANTAVANLAVSATGVSPPTPVADVNPLALDLGAVTVGATSSRTFTVGNVGTAALSVTLARAAGTSAEYSAAPGTFQVAAGGSTTVTVTYAPTDVGADVGSLLVQSNDPLQPSVPVTLSGSGVAAPTPRLALAPPALDLGGVTVGASASLPTQVTNSGTAALTVSAIARCAGTSSEFTWSPAAPFTVAIGGSTTLNVTYTPAAAGADTGCLTLASNDPNQPAASLAVQGLGLQPAAPQIAVTPGALDFGSVLIGLTASRTLDVGNSGNASLTASVARGAGTSAEFTATPATLTVAPGGSGTVTVAYAPSGAGADTGSIVLSSNDPARPTVTVTVAGSGMAAPAPAIALDPTALAFGPVVTGSSRSLPVAIRNQGAAPLQVSSIARCSATSAEFTWSPSAPLQVDPGQAATVTVTYGPTEVGSDAGCLAVASDDPASPTVNLALSGSGVAQAAPAIALDPASLDFGTVTLGGSATRTSQVRNAGTATLHVSAVTACAGTSAEFAFTLAAPFDVAPGAAMPLAVVYTPVDAGTDQGCLTVASDAAATPMATLALAGIGAPPSQNVGDIDIAELHVPESVRTLPRAIVPRAELVNRSSVRATGTARLKGVLDGSDLYDETIPVNLPRSEDGDFTFPTLTLATGATGTLVWTLTVDDGNPDIDQAQARTRIRIGGGGGGGGGEGEDDRMAPTGPMTSSRASTSSVAGSGGGMTGTVAASTAGCTTGGSSASLGLLVVLGALGLAPRRRRAR